MVYAYRLKKSSDKGMVIEGFAIRRTWQFSSDPKAEMLSKWAVKVDFLKAADIKALKALINSREKEGKEEPDGESSAPSERPSSVPGDRVLKTRLNGMNLTELKQFAKEKGLPEDEYSTFTRSRLIDYLLLAVNE